MDVAEVGYMRIRAGVIVVLLGLIFAGCGGITPGSQTPTGPGPAAGVATGYEVSLNAPMHHERLTLDLENKGGPGVFKLVFAGYATTPEGEPEACGEA